MLRLDDGTICSVPPQWTDVTAFDPEILWGKWFDAVPFFWTIQYVFGLGNTGHAEHFDQAEIAGSLEARDWDYAITYRLADQTVAFAIVQHDIPGLQAEVDFERRVAGKEWAETYQG